MKKLNEQIEQLEAFISKGRILNETVSQRGVDWHIEHSLKVLNGISTILQSQTALEIDGNVNMIGRIVLTTGIIPKGRGKAPEAVNNKEEVDLEAIPILISELKSNLKKLEDVPKRASYKHPYFKTLNKKRALRFLEIHTQHHIKIIKDILKK